MQKRNISYRWALPALMALVFALFFFTSSQTAHAATNCALADVPQAQCEALLDFYDTTNGDDWFNNTNWGQTDLVCEWYGVFCNGTVVTGLFLDNNNLTGTIPASFADLTTLEELWLGFNELSGSFPTAFLSLTELDSLYLTNNQFSGSLPAGIGNLTNLKSLLLGGNQFTGTLPAEIFDLDLIGLDLSHEFSSGALPYAFTGAIPAGISNMENLAYLILNNNEFTGPMPALSPDAPLEILQLTRAFEKGESFFPFNPCSGLDSGNISTWLNGTTYPLLGSISLGDNCFTGPIPDMTGAPIRFASLQNNPWTSGPIPAWITSSTIMESVTIGGANRSGTLPAMASPELVQFIADNNGFTGNIPTSFNGTNHPNLEFFNVFNNSLSGDIPTEVGTLTTLRFFSVQGNNFTSLPDSIVTGWATMNNDPNAGKLWINFNQFDPDNMSTALVNFVDSNSRPLPTMQFPVEWRELQTLPPGNVQVTNVTGNSVTLSWTKRGDDLYPGRFEVGVSQTPGGPYTFDAANFTDDKDDTTLTVSGLDPETTYYFVVRKHRFFIININFAPTSISVNSAEVNATTTDGPGEPPTERPTAPELVSPTDDAELVGELPVFTWNTNPANEQVTVYRLTVLSNNNTVLRNLNVQATNCAATCEVDGATLGIDFRSTTYRWRVQARNAVGNRNSETLAFSLDIPGSPVAVSPRNEDTPAVTTFRWELAGAANEFRLQVFNNQNVRVFRSAWLEGSALGCVAIGDVCEFEVSDGLANGNHTWQVLARNTADFPGITSRTGREIFRVFYPFLPVLTEPILGETVGIPTPDLTWQDANNSDVVQYRVIVQRPNGNLIYRSQWVDHTGICTGGTCVYQPTQPLPNGNFRWAVQVRDTTLTERYVKRTGFETFSVAFPATPTALSPINGDTVTTPSPQVAFADPLNATEFRIIIRNAATRVIVFNSGWGTADCNAGVCEYTLADAIANGNYQWRVLARNSAIASNTSNSGWQDFRVQSPGAPSNLGGSIGSSVTWDFADSATEFRVQIQRTNNNNQVYTSGWIICFPQTCEHNVDATLAPREYRWRVQARNVNGIRNSPWVIETLTP